MDVEQSDGCAYDYILINGERICGYMVADAVKVFMFKEQEKAIKFVTDAQTTRQGFDLRVKQITDCYPENILPPPPACSYCSDVLEGEVVSYDYPLDYRNNLLCTYTIDRNSRDYCRLALTFLDFDVHYTPGCEADYLQIAGQRFCGTELQGQMHYISFENHGSLTFAFKTDGSSVRRGFRAEFRQVPCYVPLLPTEISPISCDRIYGQASFNIDSPNHPDNYDNDLDCTYIVRRVSDNICQLRLTFVTFDVEGNGDNCSKDYLEINGTRLCGTLPAEHSRTVGFLEEEESIRFHTDGSTTRPGFLARVEQVECQKETVSCDQSVRGFQADILSSNYPNNYLNNQDCRYTIHRYSNNICSLRITFVDFNIQSGDTCQFDYLQASNFKFCGSTPGGTERELDFSRPEFHLLFHTDDNSTDKGFHLRVTQIPCSATTTQIPTTSSTVTIPTPTFPTVPTRPIITTPESLVRTTPETVSNQTTPMPYFCDIVFDLPEFVITSPNYPQPYPGNLTCNYSIRRSTPGVCAIELVFTDFNVEDDPDCAGDYFEVEDQRFCGTVPSGQNIRTFIFDQQEKNLRFVTNELVSNVGFQIRVRQIDCEVTPTKAPSPEECLEVYNTADIEVKSPNYPERYGNNVNCTYIIHRSSPDICELKMQIVHFDLESSTGCEYDYLLVDGERLCGTLAENMTRIYDFREPNKFFLFHSDAASARDGFYLRLKQLPCHFVPSPPSPTPTTQCDRVYTGREFQIRSENYPAPYSNDLNCRYTIRKFSPSVCKLQLDFLNFDVESSAGCQYDYLEADYSRFCGIIPPNTFRMFDFLPYEKTLRFRSDSGTMRSGFVIKVTQLDCEITTLLPVPSPKPEACVHTFSGVTGRLQSPNFPNRYPENTNCKYKIQAAPEHCHVELSFSTFWLEPVNGPCTQDYLQINGVRYCGRQLEGHTKTVEYEDEWKAVVLQFVSNEFLSGLGFEATYRQVPCSSIRQPEPAVPKPKVYCDRLLGSLEFEISSPETSDPVDCHYTVPRLDDRFCKIRLLFLHFDVESNTGCEDDYVEINGQKVCGTLAEGTTRDYEFGQDTYQIQIHFHGNPNASHFLIRGEQLDCEVSHDAPPHPVGNCDQVVATENFELLSPNYPKPYPNGIDCRYIVRKSNPSVCGLELNFLEFHLEDTQECQNDYFSIDDRRVCGTLEPETIRTYDFLKSEKLLYFKSDHDINASGFYIRGRQVTCATQPPGRPPIPPPEDLQRSCDAVFMEEEILLNSPNFPSPYPPGIFCRYSIRRRSNNVCALEVTFLTFDLQDSPGCRQDYLDIEGRKLCGVVAENTYRRYDFLMPEYEKILLFHSDEMSSRPGFSLRIRQVTDCGIMPWVPMPFPSVCEYCKRDIQGQLTSPNYPRSYPNDLSCSYHVQPATGYCALEVFFVDFDVEPSAECLKDYFLIKGQRFCGSDLRRESKIIPFPWQLESQVNFEFRSDRFGTGRGFHIEYRQLRCRGSRDYKFGANQTIQHFEDLV